MFRLIRWAVSLVIFAIVVFFATTVQLGKRTLFGHIWAIIHTPEAKDLAEGTKEQAKRVAEKMKSEMKNDGAPKDAVTTEEQRDLDKLVREKSGKSK
jgi:hypothetical protein